MHMSLHHVTTHIERTDPAPTLAAVVEYCQSHPDAPFPKAAFDQWRNQVENVVLTNRNDYAVRKSA